MEKTLDTIKSNHLANALKPSGCIEGRGPSERLSLCLYFLLFLFSFPLHLVSQDWLTKFGYLPPPDPVTGQLQTQEELTKAITAMQRFGGLEATGVLGQWLMTPPLLGEEQGRDGLLWVRGGEGTWCCVLE